MEQPGVVAGNFAPSFSLNFLSIFVHIYGSIGPITLIWTSLERTFPPAEVEYRWCQFRSKVMTSEEEERPRFVTGGYGQHRRQWVNSTSAFKIHAKQQHRSRIQADFQKYNNYYCVASRILSWQHRYQHLHANLSVVYRKQTPRDRWLIRIIYCCWWIKNSQHFYNLLFLISSGLRFHSSSDSILAFAGHWNICGHWSY